MGTCVYNPMAASKEGNLNPKVDKTWIFFNQNKNKIIIKNSN
jgi:hypothetical protein